MSDAQKTPHLSLVTLDTSQSPQDITTTRLPTPSQQRFCEPCRAFLRGDSTECFGSDKWLYYNRHEYIHHLDAESFQRALELPCSICIRLHKAFESEHDHSAYSMGPTRYHKQPGESKPFRFMSPDCILDPTLEPYESRPDLHYRHITQNTGDAKALSFLRNQYHECREEHPKCQRLAAYNNFTPTRTIHVGFAGEEVVRLCDRIDMVSGAAYTVLSHCWGKPSQNLMLRKSTLEILKEGIALSSLPKTFQDAIAVTRTFQIQYIWIDSLCIFQDDLQDWAVEASRMRDVYSKADLCIAATGAQSGDIGLFFGRDIELLTPVRIEATWLKNHDLLHWPSLGSYLFGFHNVRVWKAIDNAPLNRRAWVAQERFLSKRTLHFTQSLLFWECPTSFTSENDAMARTSLHSRLTSLKTRLNCVQWPDLDVDAMQDITLDSTNNDTKLREVYLTWCQFLYHYTSCGITRESDILVALVGVADEVGHAMSDCMVAGLWKTRFIEELCWRSHGDTSRPIVWRAPSWSWASLSNPVLPSACTSSHIPHEMAAVIELCISKKSSGEVEQGSALIECRPISATVQYSGAEGSNGAYNALGTLDESVWAFSEKSNPERSGLIEVQLDDTDALCYHDDQVLDVQLLALLEFSFGPGSRIKLEGICVVDSEHQAGASERVGSFYTFDEAAELVLAAYGRARVQAILLI